MGNPDKANERTEPSPKPTIRTGILSGLRPRFGLRSLLALTGLAGVAFGLVIPWHLRAQVQHQAIERIELQGGCVAYNFEYPSLIPYRQGRSGNRPADPNYFCRLIGSEYFRTPVFVALNYQLDEFCAVKHPPHRSIDEDSEQILALKQLRRSLKHLDLRFTLVNDLSILEGFDNLEILNAERQEITELGPLRNLERLQVLYLHDNPIENYAPLGQLTSLRELHMRWHELEDFEDLRNCEQLEVLNAEGKLLEDISGLAGKTRLRVLNVGFSKVSNLAPLAGMDLTSLNISRSQVADIGALKDCEHLECLEATGTLISDLSPLENKTKLRRLFLDHTSVSDLMPLRNLRELQAIGVSGTQVVDGNVLLELPKLQRCFVPEIVAKAIGDQLPLGRN